jgi:putative transposase
MSEKKSLPAITNGVLNQLLVQGDIKDAFVSGGLFDALKKALAERVLNAEMDHYLETDAAERHDNRRNGVGRETVLTDTG